MACPPNDSQVQPPGRFPTTSWSVVLKAGRRQTHGSRAALAKLCETYWYPVYAYVRKTGCSAEQAQDSVQGFFTGLLEKEGLRGFRSDRGRFRSYLIGALKHYLADQRKRELTQKRGGAVIHLPLQDAELRYAEEPEEETTPERLYTRRWAMSLLERVLQRLREEYVEAGKKNLFDRLKGLIAESSPDDSYKKASAELGMSEGAVKVAVHRLRRRYRDRLRAEIAETLSEPGDI
ncbi:MAG: sigma-70 family RNA polymerase sigma factor, partial [Acidobacteria bacterium]|nr:sigma-70 family RNA polymerase sigma factor [Acidobacteriota bacterium]NIQ87461.1 sigma-70 family RNA polymerase sigma factor [Acidobacteriota bacterium]